MAIDELQRHSCYVAHKEAAGITQHPLQRDDDFAAAQRREPRRPAPEREGAIVRTGACAGATAGARCALANKLQRAG